MLYTEASNTSQDMAYESKAIIKYTSRPPTLVGIAFPRVRVRARNLKTKTGCQTCRVRWIKCDEFNPWCRKCTSTGRKYDGYDTPEVFCTGPICKNEDSRIAPVNYSQPLESHILDTLGNLTYEETMAFGFFRQKTVTEIHGCFYSNLWVNLILQISHHEPSVLHAAIALSCAHRQHMERYVLRQIAPSQDPRHMFGIRQCVKAIRFLRTRINERYDPQSSQVALVTCLLFISLEMLQGQRLAALSYFGTGLRILSSEATSTSIDGSKSLNINEDSEDISDQLIGIFGRLDYESTMFGQRSPHFLLFPQQPSIRTPSIPTAFSGVSEARKYVDMLASIVLRFRGNLLSLAADIVPSTGTDFLSQACWEHATTRNIDLSDHPRLFAERLRLQDGLAVWRASLYTFKNGLSVVDMEEKCQAISLLEIQYFYSYFLISTCQTTKEKICGSFNSLFERVVSLAHSYIRGAGTSTPSGGTHTPPLFTLDSGVLPSLYLTAMKCRSPKTRREAISLLYEASCQEGMWEGSLIAQFVERIADLKEARANNEVAIKKSCDIREEARCCDVVLAASKDPTKGRLIYARYYHETDGRLVVWEEEFCLKR